MIRASIVTVSLGETRVFWLRRYGGKGLVDFRAGDGTILLMPYETNRAWTHEVLARRKYQGRRISITLRAFESVESD